MMEQAIEEFKAAHVRYVKCEQQIKDIWNAYLAEDDVRGKKKLLKQRSAAIRRCGNLGQKRNIAEAKMIRVIESQVPA